MKPIVKTVFKNASQKKKFKMALFFSINFCKHAKIGEKGREKL